MSAGWVAGLVDAARAAADARGARTLDLRLAGMSVRVHLVGTALADALEPGLLVRGDCGVRPDVELWAVDGVGVPVPRLPWDAKAYLPREEVRGWTQPPYLASFDVGHGTLCAADTDAGVGVQWLRDAGAMAPWESGSPLRHLLRWTLAARGAQLLHAAAVGVPGGAGVLLLGPGGSGKSTTALACLQAGLPFVADDYTLVRADARPSAHPAFACAKATGDTLTLLGDGRVRDLATGAVHDWRGKSRMAVGAHVRDTLDLDAVVLPSVGARPVPPRRLPPREALSRVTAATLMQCPGDGDGVLRTLGALMAAVPVYEVPLGADLDAVPGALAEALAEARAA